MTDEFGEVSIGDNLFLYIRKVLPEGSTILELGSGWGTSQLVKYYNVFSVEHDPEYQDLYHDQYLCSPLKQHKAVKNHEGEVWYDAKVLGGLLLGLEYDLLLIDGPPTYRAGFVKYFSLFDSTAIMIFDDVNRSKDNKVMVSIAGKLDVPFVTYGAGSEKLFGVINDPNQR